jgi:putative transposase
MLAHRESAMLAERFIHATCSRQGIDRGQLTIHADRGPAMTSKPVALLLADRPCRSPGTLPRRSPAPAGAPSGSLDQSAEDPGTFADIVGASALRACSR